MDTVEGVLAWLDGRTLRLLDPNVRGLGSSCLTHPTPSGN
jgi:hypothetical protein